MSEEEINELIEYNLDYSIEEDLEETKKCLKEANKEIERLTENNQAYQEELCKVWEERDILYRRIYKAVDNLETPYFRECEQQCKDVISILKDSDKE